MPSPKSGKKVTSVKPAAPKEVYEADTPDPIKMAEVKEQQRKTESGKYGSVKHKPHSEPTDENEDEEDLHWVAIVLKTEEKDPIPGVAYRITLPDGSVDEGTLGSDGSARVDGITSGQCKIEFPSMKKWYEEYYGA